LERNQAARGRPEADPWEAVRLVARDLGFEVAGDRDRWRSERVVLSPGRSMGGPLKVTAGDLSSLRAENDVLIRTCCEYLGALARAGTSLGLGGWVVLSETSGVVLEMAVIEGVPASCGGPVPEPGLVLSLQAAGLNPVGLALHTGAVAVVPPDVQSGRRGGRRLHGLGVPLGRTAVPVGCLAVLLAGGTPSAAVALMGQALFSARTVELSLALRRERLDNLRAAASLAHEVKNPLAAVKGFLQLALADEDGVPKYAGVALRELDRAIGLLEDFSLFSCAPRITPDREVSVDGLLSEAALLARGLVAGGPPVVIDYEDSGSEAKVLADPKRLKQVILNLCRNAVDAMPHGGRLSLRAKTDNGEVIIEVSDTGCGIPPSELGRIFEPFYTTKEAGTGLGLPVCRRIVEAHGGRITVESQPGRGTTLRVHLPLHLTATRKDGGRR